MMATFETRSMRTLLLPVLLALPLVAQDDAPVRLLHAELAGPAAWQERLRPTNLGTLLASAEGEALWRPWAEQLGQMLPGLLGADGAALPKAWLAYAGTVEVVVLGRPGEGEEPNISGRVTFGVDEASDVAALATSTLRLAAGAMDLDFGPAFEGSDLMVARVDQWLVTLPKVTAGRATVYFGNDKAGLRQLVAAELPAAAGPANPRTPLLRVRFDLQAAERLRVASGGTEVGQMVALGFGTLREFELSVAASGPHVQGELGITFGAGERGLFAGLFPARAGVPALFWAVPPQARAWKVGRCDTMAIWHAVLRAIAVDGASEEKTAAEAREETGVDIEKDVLAHLTDEVMVAWHPQRDAEQHADDLGLCLAFALRDEAAFQAGFGKLLRSSGELEVREADGVLRADQEGAWFMPTVAFAVGKGLAILALGDNAVAHVDAVLGQAGKKASMPKEFEVHLRTAPAGFNSVGTIELGVLLRHYLQGLVALLDLPGDGPSHELEAVMDKEILPLLAKQHLDRLLTLTGGTAEAWRFRVLW